MSADDPLVSAFAALREVHDGDPNGAETRARVLAGARRRADGKRRLLYALIPAAATLLVSVAWADGTGRLASWRTALREALEPSRTFAPPVSAPVVSPSRRPLPLRDSPRPPALDPDAAAKTDERAAPEARAAVIERPPRPAPRRPAAKSVETPSEVKDAEGDLFAAANAAHFGGHDPVRALRAWDAYLATFPRGRFELEARYNRATTLLRLGRDEEARAALLPFLDGPYRQREAHLLLQAIGEGH